MGSRFRDSLEPRISFFAFQDIITSTSGILIIVVLLLGTFLGSPAILDSTRKHPHQKVLEDSKAKLEQEIHLLEVSLSEIQKKNIEVNPEKIERDLIILKNINQNLQEKIEQMRGYNRERKAIMQGIISRSGLEKAQMKLEAFQKQNEDQKNAVEELRQKNDRLDRKIKQLSAKVTLAEAEKNKIWLLRDGKTSSKAPLILFLSPQEARLWEFDRPQKNYLISPESSIFLSDLKKYLESYRPVDVYVVIYVQPGSIALFQDALKLIKEELRFEVGWDAVEEGVVIQTGIPPDYQLEEPEVISSRPGSKI